MCLVFHVTALPFQMQVSLPYHWLRKSVLCSRWFLVLLATKGVLSLVVYSYSAAPKLKDLSEF